MSSRVKIAYDTGSSLPTPVLRIRIIDTFSKLEFGPFTALVDSGADYTCIPNVVAERVSGYNYDWRDSEDFSGNVVPVRVVRVLDGLVDFLDSDGKPIVSAKHANLVLPIVQSGLLGRDILNSYRCVLDGPSLAGEIG